MKIDNRTCGIVSTPLSIRNHLRLCGRKVEFEKIPLHHIPLAWLKIFDLFGIEKVFLPKDIDHSHLFGNEVDCWALLNSHGTLGMEKVLEKLLNEWGYNWIIPKKALNEIYIYREVKK